MSHRTQSELSTRSTQQHEKSTRVSDCFIRSGLGTNTSEPLQLNVLVRTQEAVEQPGQSVSVPATTMQKVQNFWTLIVSRPFTATIMNSIFFIVLPILQDRSADNFPDRMSVLKCLRHHQLPEVGCHTCISVCGHGAFTYLRVSIRCI